MLNFCNQNRCFILKPSTAHNENEHNLPKLTQTVGEIVQLPKMSNIYIQEPPTNGKVLLITTCGEIDIELWSKEAPKACRNFIQLCLEGYYNGTIFHRIVKGMSLQA